MTLKFFKNPGHPEFIAQVTSLMAEANRFSIHHGLPHRILGSAEAVLYDFPDFTTVEDVEFRVYWGGTAPGNGKSRVYLDEFVLNGQVLAEEGSPVPEPATLLLALLGLALLPRRRRR